MPRNIWSQTTNCRTLLTGINPCRIAQNASFWVKSWCVGHYLINAIHRFHILRPHTLIMLWMCHMYWSAIYSMANKVNSLPFIAPSCSACHLMLFMLLLLFVQQLPTVVSGRCVTLGEGRQCYYLHLSIKSSQTVSCPSYTRSSRSK